MSEVGFTVVGSGGRLFVNDDEIRLVQLKGKSLQWYRQDLNDNVSFWLGLPEYYREDLHFVDSLRSGTQASPDFSSAAKVDKIVDEVIG